MNGELMDYIKEFVRNEVRLELLDKSPDRALILSHGASIQSTPRSILNDLNIRIFSMQNELDANKSRIISMQNELDANKSRIISMQNELDANKSRIISMQNELDANKRIILVLTIATIICVVLTAAVVSCVMLDIYTIVEIRKFLFLFGSTIVGISFFAALYGIIEKLILKSNTTT